MSKILLLLFSLGFSLLTSEIILVMLGRYNDVVNPTYSADLIWERPTSTTEFGTHPDLGFSIPIKFDHSGVRNDDPTETEDKKNVYAFFGDSFTENRRVLSEFSFTEILGDLIRNASIVNYGVDGYGLDQAYLRYKKFSDHDIKRVFYVFCSNDFKNLYETNLVSLTQNNELIFVKPKRNWAIDFIGKFRLTYLFIESYYRLKGINHSEGELSRLYSAKQTKYNEYAIRHNDKYAYSLLQALLSKSYVERSDLSALRNKFRILLLHWSDELKSKGIKFDIVVLPQRLESLAARNLFADLPLNVLYLSDFVDNNNEHEYYFKDDLHWNEKGNLLAAIEIYKYLGYELAADDPTIKKIRSGIEDLYAGHLVPANAVPP
jgi:hypothetical protein